MERLVLVAVSIVWLGGLAALGYVVLSGDGDEVDTEEVARATRERLVPAADLRACGPQGGGRLNPAPGRDAVIGPVSFIDSPSTYRSSFRGRAYVTPDYLPGLSAHPMEVVALVEAGRHVRLVVPRSQRAWMRLFYRTGDDSGQRAISLESCERSSSTFGGGLYVDFDNAPQGGRCAELEVQIPGEARVHRGRVFGPRRGECRELPVRVSPSRGTPRTVFRVAFSSGGRLGTSGRRRQGYRVSVRGPAEAACVTDHDAFADRGRPRRRLTVRIDPSRAKGRRWCRGRFRGRLIRYSTFACPSRGACRRPANLPARDREVGRFSFTVR